MTTTAAAPPVGAACPAPSPGTTPRARAPDDGRPLVFYGHGIGHGMGMSQYGARGAALLGCSAAQILSTYYPGTRVRRIDTSARLDLLLFSNGPGHRATVTVDADPLRDATVRWQHRGRLVAMQKEGSTWTVSTVGKRTRLVDRDGRIRFAQPATGLFPLRGWHTGRVVTVRTYRHGALHLERRLKYDASQFFATGGRLDARQNFVTNSAGVSMDKYLYGLAEVPVSWPAATQRAQAIAARTFAHRLARPLRPTPADQYYGGYDPERDSPRSAWRRAVDRTSGLIVVDAGGRPIEALYSASMGGHAEDPRYVWGVGAVPYLQAVDDSRWNAAASDPYVRWVRTYRYQRIADEFGFDRVSAMSVARRGTTARHRGVTITGRIAGEAVTRDVTGWDVRQRLDLPSPGVFIVTR
jgi:stage II sporulation protein D